VIFNSLEDVFQKKLLLYVEKEWETWLAVIVKDLPNKNRVMEDLKAGLTDVFRKTC
jgi:hypothetical protein